MGSAWPADEWGRPEPETVESEALWAAEQGTRCDTAWPLSRGRGDRAVPACERLAADLLVMNCNDTLFPASHRFEIGAPQ